MDMTKLVKEPKVLFAIVAVLIALVAISPVPVQGPDGKMNLKTNVALGLDLQGGVRALIAPQDATQAITLDAIDVLTRRINAFGLQEMAIKPVQVGDKWMIQLEIAGADESQLKALLEKQGKFDATIKRSVDIASGKGTFVLNSVPYAISIDGGNALIKNGTSTITVKPNEVFSLEGISFNYTNSTNESVVFEGTVFQGRDIVQVFTDAQHARINPTGTGSWSFDFQVSVSKESAERFAKITKNLEEERGAGFGKSYLASDLNLYLDDALVDSLKISSSTKGLVLTQPLISGPGDSKDDALLKMKNLQSILKSGALPTKIEVVQLASVSPSLGKEFVRLSVLAIIAAIVAVSIVIFIRYRDPKLSIPIILTSGTEVFLIFGFAALVRWTIDLAAIAGIIAAIGTGVDNQILIADETGAKSKEVISMKRRLKNAFFIIFTSAGTMIAAMVPLLSVGAGSVRGFAFTTIAGILIGVLITRPMFAKIIEHQRSGEVEG